MKRKPDSTPGPMLRRHLEIGTIWVEERVYAGAASDSIVVHLGEVGDEANIEKYLEEFPEPANW